MATRCEHAAGASASGRRADRKSTPDRVRFCAHIIVVAVAEPERGLALDEGACARADAELWLAALEDREARAEQLSDGLYLEITAPAPVLPHFLDVRLEVLFHKWLEPRAVEAHVITGRVAQELRFGLAAQAYLGARAEEAVAVGRDLSSPIAERLRQVRRLELGGLLPC